MAAVGPADALFSARVHVSTPRERQRFTMDCRSYYKGNECVNPFTALSLVEQDVIPNLLNICGFYSR